MDTADFSSNSPLVPARGALNILLGECNWLVDVWHTRLRELAHFCRMNPRRLPGIGEFFRLDLTSFEHVHRLGLEAFPPSPDAAVGVPTVTAPYELLRLAVALGMPLSADLHRLIESDFVTPVYAVPPETIEVWPESLAVLFTFGEIHRWRIWDLIRATDLQDSEAGDASPAPQGPRRMSGFFADGELTPGMLEGRRALGPWDREIDYDEPVRSEDEWFSQYQAGLPEREYIGAAVGSSELVPVESPRPGVERSFRRDDVLQFAEAVGVPLSSRMLALAARTESRRSTSRPGASSSSEAKRPVRADSEEPVSEQSRICKRSPDGRCVVWKGVQYTLTTNRAIVIEVLWDAWEDGPSDVAQETLWSRLDKCGRGASPRRMRDVFKGAPKMMQALVREGDARGTWRMND